MCFFNFFYYRWRAERQKSDLKQEVQAKKEMLSHMAGSRKTWTLDEDGDDDEEPGVAPTTENGETVAEEVAEEKIEEEEEEDALDAFMRGVQDEIRKVSPAGLDILIGCTYLSLKFYDSLILIETRIIFGVLIDLANKGKANAQKYIVKTGVRKVEKKNKGELIEQNMDGLEVSFNSDFVCRFYVHVGLLCRLYDFFVFSIHLKKKEKI